MAEIMLALARTFASLRCGRVWLYVLTPALCALLLTIALAVWGLGWLAEQLLALPPMTWLAAWGLVWLATFLAWLGGWLAIFAVAYLVSSLLAAIVILPLLLKHLSETEYRDLAMLGRDSFVAATLNSLGAALLFVLLWVLTIPLWLIPGLSLVVPLLLMAWLNRRTFAYDALSAHASEEEWQVLSARHKGPFLLLGLCMALLAHVPLLGLLAPALAALAFVHYGLESLRRLRQEALPGEWQSGHE
ncbi:MAG TPA: EI24 domain-containing protein [Rhodocyclaceae bacterium]|nr:EI24 domain-containing protein [Rhodocyclaceae bacterium]